MARFPRTEPEVMDLAIPNGIALAQAMVSGLTGTLTNGDIIDNQFRIGETVKIVLRYYLRTRFSAIIGKKLIF